MIRDRSWILTVPAILILGIVSGWLSNSGYGNAWFDALAKPSFMPPAWAFPVVWTCLYILMGVALAQVIAGNGPARRSALILFALQLALNLAWSPIFFGLHAARIALAIVVAMVALVLATIAQFRRIRRSAAWLMLPYLAWLFMATALNFEIVRLNP